MASLAGMAGVIDKVESPFVTVHQERCALVRNRNADCLKCAQVCTTGCIRFEGGVLSISPEKCIGCGTCATVCPTCCLEAHHPNDAELLEACVEQLTLGVDRQTGHVGIACSRVLDGLGDDSPYGGCVRVECLGRVEEALLTRLVAEGAADVALVHAECATCPHATGKTVCDQVLRTEERLLDAWGVRMPVHLVQVFVPHPEVPANQADETPCDTGFDRLPDGEDEAAPGGDAETGHARPKPRYQKVMADGTLPHFVPDRRERLLDALSELGEPREGRIETRLWGHVEIDVDSCVSCRMCAVFCPTGAIRKLDAPDGTFGVTHFPGDCVKCMTCENICRHQAIKVLDDVDATDLLAGVPHVIAMRPQAVARGRADTIERLAQTYTATAVYTR